MHGDHHGLWIDPANTDVIYNANDGGFYQTADAGKTWKFAVSAAGAQFYNVELDTSSPVWAYGSIQDHGSRRGRVDLSKGRDQIPAVAWEGAPGGEGSNHAVDPTNPNIVYSHGFYGNFTRTDLSVAGRRGRGRGADTPPPTGPQREVAIQPTDPDRRAARAVDGAVHHLAARQQHRLRRLSSSCSGRRAAATSGRRSAPI